MPPKKTLGTRIRELRLSKKMTQVDLAKKIGIVDTYLSKIENNKLDSRKGPGEKVIRKLTKALTSDTSHSSFKDLYEELMLLADKIPETLKKDILNHKDELLRQKLRGKTLYENYKTIIKIQKEEQTRTMMDPRSLKPAETEAENLLSDYNKQFGGEILLPIPVELIAELFYNLRIERETLEDNIPGKLLFKEKRIIINAHDMLEKQKFTIAHELGHIRLHVNEQGNIIYDQKKTSWMDIQANAFAASLLMPKRLVGEAFIKELLNIDKVRNIKNRKGILIMAKRAEFKPNFLKRLIHTYVLTNQKESFRDVKPAKLLVSLIPIVARQFQVSKETLAWRLKNLGLTN